MLGIVILLVLILLAVGLVAVCLFQVIDLLNRLIKIEEHRETWGSPPPRK